MSMMINPYRFVPAGGGGTAYSARIISLSPYWYLPLDETSGSVAADATANGNDATYASVVTYDAGALNNEGSSVELATTVSSAVVAVPTPINLPEITLELWIASTTGNTGNNLFTEDSDASAERHWIFRTSGSGDSVEFVKIANGITTVTGTAVVFDGNPHHVVVTYDGSTISIYVDGVLDNSEPASGDIVNGTVNSNGPRLSNTARYSSAGVPGKYAHAALYEYSLTAAEVADNYSAGTAIVGGGSWTPAALDNKVGWWDVGELTGLADGDSIGSLTDRWGNQDATASGTERPTYKTSVLNGLPVARLVNANDSHFTATYPSAITVPTTTWMVVDKRTALSMFLWSHARSSGISLCGALVSDTTRRYTNGASSVTIDTPSAGWAIVILTQFADGSADVWIDGTEHNLTSVGTINTWVEIGIGYRIDNATNHMEGDIAEVGEVNDALTAFERSNLQSYLETKYAL